MVIFLLKTVKTYQNVAERLLTKWYPFEQKFYLNCTKVAFKISYLNKLKFFDYLVWVFGTVQKFCHLTLLMLWWNALII